MRIINILRVRYIEYILKPCFKTFSYIKLKSTHREQLERFRKNRKKFNELYQSVKHQISPDFTHETWKEFNNDMETQLLPYPKVSLYHYPIILQTMSDNAINRPCELFIDQIQKNMQGANVASLINEDLIGVPMLLTNCAACKSTSIHRVAHTYHASLCSKATSNFTKTSIVTEWGGGFGGLARVFNRIKDFQDVNFTYNIIDLPIVCCIQWLYLSSILGENKINLVTNKQSKFEKGKINIVPNGLINDFLDELKCDLFISNWALSESSPIAQEFVARKNFFNAGHGLIMHQIRSQMHPYAENIKGLLKNNSIVFEEQIIPHTNNQCAYFLW